MLVMHQVEATIPIRVFIPNQTPEEQWVIARVLLDAGGTMQLEFDNPDFAEYFWMQSKNEVVRGLELGCIHDVPNNVGEKETDVPG